MRNKVITVDASTVKRLHPQYTLGFKLGWALKPEYPSQVMCQRCRGKGKTGGGFHDLDEPKDCTTCWGAGTVPNTEITATPLLPPDYFQHMKKAHTEWMEAQERAEKILAAHKLHQQDHVEL